MLKPKPGKVIKHSVSSSGNRHKRGAYRVSIKIEITLTCEPEEADRLVDSLKASIVLPIDDELHRHSSFCENLIAVTPARRKNLIAGLKWAAYDARLSNWSAGTGPYPDEPEDLDS